MENFKVICKTDGDNWEQVPRTSKLVTTTKFFGLLKSSKMVSSPTFVPGPCKEEICIVTGEYISNDDKYYNLAGYPYGGYNSKYFIRLDEFTETQKEIAEKTKAIELQN